MGISPHTILLFRGHRSEKNLEKETKQSLEQEDYEKSVEIRTSSRAEIMLDVVWQEGMRRKENWPLAMGCGS